MSNILVNTVKVKRAEDIVKWIEEGGHTAEESNFADKFGPLVKGEKDKVEAVYILLGGLVRSEADERTAKQKEKDAKAALKAAKAAGKSIEALENDESNLKFEDEK